MWTNRAVSVRVTERLPSSSATTPSHQKGTNRSSFNIHISLFLFNVNALSHVGCGRPGFCPLIHQSTDNKIFVLLVIWSCINSDAEYNKERSLNCNSGQLLNCNWKQNSMYYIHSVYGALTSHLSLVSNNRLIVVKSDRHVVLAGKGWNQMLRRMHG